MGTRRARDRRAALLSRRLFSAPISRVRVLCGGSESIRPSLFHDLQAGEPVLRSSLVFAASSLFRRAQSIAFIRLALLAPSMVYHGVFARIHRFPILFLRSPRRLVAAPRNSLELFPGQPPFGLRFSNETAGPNPYPCHLFLQLLPVAPDKRSAALRHACGPGLVLRVLRMVFRSYAAAPPFRSRCHSAVVIPEHNQCHAGVDGIDAEYLDARGLSFETTGAADGQGERSGPCLALHPGKIFGGNSGGVTDRRACLSRGPRRPVRRSGIFPGSLHFRFARCSFSHDFGAREPFVSRHRLPRFVYGRPWAVAGEGCNPRASVSPDIELVCTLRNPSAIAGQFPAGHLLRRASHSLCFCWSVLFRGHRALDLERGRRIYPSGFAGKCLFLRGSATRSVRSFSISSVAAPSAL